MCRKLIAAGGVSACTALFVAAVVADHTADILSQATIAEYHSYLRVLTGIDPVPGDPPYYLTNRYSFGPDIHVAGQWIADLFTSFGLNASYHVFNPAYGPNVIGELPGIRRPEDIYIICAHYDTYHQANQYLAPGCDDNASGTAGVIMAGRILGQYPFAGTLRFIAFSGEEQWMVGSQAYVQAAYYAGENIVAAVNLDMILHPTFDNMEPDPDHDLDIESDPASQPLAQYLLGQLTAYTPLAAQVHVDANLVSDHWSFWQFGYKAVGFGENTTYEIWNGSNDAYHQLTDTMYNPDYEWDFGLGGIRGGLAGLIGMAELVIAPSTCPGDLNCDGLVSFDDISPFVDALAGFAAWHPQHPACPWLNGDTNGDLTVDFGDIDPFVGLLSSGAQCP